MGTSDKQVKAKHLDTWEILDKAYESQNTSEASWVRYEDKRIGAIVLLIMLINVTYMYESLHFQPNTDKGKQKIDLSFKI